MTRQRQLEPVPNPGFVPGLNAVPGFREAVPSPLPSRASPKTAADAPKASSWRAGPDQSACEW